MSLKKKIALGFIFRVCITAAIVFFGYLNYSDVRGEIRYLELSDTIRSKTLQLRRHEKNYLLYRDPKEIETVYLYLKEINDIFPETDSTGKSEKLMELKTLTGEYGRTFNDIENIVWEFQNEIAEIRKSRIRHPVLLPLIEAASLESPLISAEALRKAYSLPGEHPAIRELEELDADIKTLRALGEKMVAFS